jgi:hypothetical protein
MGVAMSGLLALPTEPVFQAFRDNDSDLVTVSRGYREPAFFVTEISIENGRKR